MDDSVNIAAIVLAAGQSRRMGRTNKLLAKLNEKTLLQHVLSNIKLSVINEIIVVTGNQSESVKNSILDFNVQCVTNHQYAKGLSSSLKAGIEKLPEDADAVLICHGDMPFVTAGVIDRIVEAFAKNKKIVSPAYWGQQGNPLLWPKKYFNALTRLSGDAGARRILKNYKDKIFSLEVDDVGILLDIDNSQTLEFMQSRFNNSQEK